MKNTLILLAGYPGTGKTYLANMINERFQCFRFLSPDIIKEKNWDDFGFENLEQKEFLIQKSWNDFYDQLENLFKTKQNVISDYPYSEKQKERLKYLSNTYDYQVVTIRLIGELEVLFERQKKRDLDGTRHLGHILKSYNRESAVNHNEADNLLDYEEFVFRCKTRGYEKFSLGTLYEIDVTDFSKVNYKWILDELGNII